MIKFSRRAVVTADSEPAKSLPISELIMQGKIRVSHKTAIISVLSHWASKGCLWEWKIRKDNKGLGGYPLSLINGIRFIDRLLLGDMSHYPLYNLFPDMQWRTLHIKDAIDQFALAATSPYHYPSDPAKKKLLCKMNLEYFFWNGQIKGEPTFYVHAPFLYYHKNGAVLNDDAIARRDVESRFLFDSILSLYSSENGLYAPPTLSNKEHNRLAVMVENLLKWYKDNKERLHPNDRNLEIIIYAITETIQGWAKPISFTAFTGLTLIKHTIHNLESKATFRDFTPIQETAPVEVQELSPTAVLGELSGDMLQNLCVYGMQKNVDVMPFSVDLSRLACFSNLTLRQVLRKYQMGELSSIKQSTSSEDWKTILSKG